MTFVSCAVPQPQEALRFTAEEAAYDNEITPLVTAACRIGTIDATQYVVAADLEIPGYGTAEGSRPWSELHDRFETLLPPSGLEGLHGALVATLVAQMQLAQDYPAQVSLELGSKLPQIDSSLSSHAQDACSKYNAFLEAVKLRPPASILAPSPSPTLSVSFQPIGSPLSVGVSSTGSLSVSASQSIATPVGTVTLTTSESTASPASPRRLVVQAGGHWRVLLIDRPFQVFIPSKYGVSVASDGQQLTITVLSRGQDDVPKENWVLWTPGVEHPQYSDVIASKEVGTWNPAPGYSWDVSGTNDVKVVWTPGIKHPDYEHVIASATEGKWETEEGWKWKNDESNDFSVLPSPDVQK
jgi:hypothetical protein